MNPHDQHVAISKAMGWRIGNPENSRLDYRWWIPPGKEPRENEMFLDRPPQWTSDLNACLQLVEHMQGLGFHCILIAQGKAWCCTFTRGTDAEFKTIGETWPEAICNSFLMALGLHPEFPPK